MKYYKQDSVPLEEFAPGIGDKAYDEFGNYVEIDVCGDPFLLKRTVLKDDEKVNSFERPNGLKSFWAMSEKKRKGYEIHDSEE